MACLHWAILMGEKTSSQGYSQIEFKLAACFNTVLECLTVPLHFLKIKVHE